MVGRPSVEGLNCTWIPSRKLGVSSFVIDNKNFMWIKIKITTGFLNLDNINDTNCKNYLDIVIRA